MTRKTKGESYSGDHTAPRLKVRKDPNGAGWEAAAKAAGCHNLAQWIVEVCDAAAEAALDAGDDEATEWVKGEDGKLRRQW